MGKNPLVNIIVSARSTKIMGGSATVGFFFLHVFMQVIFNQYGVTPMIYYGAATAPMYILLLFLLWREYWRTYAFGICLQVFSYMGLAVLSVGWDAGFQLTIICICVLCFYAEYAARTMQVKTLHAINLSVVGMALYLALLVISSHNEPPYTLPDEVELGLLILWSAAVFIIIITYLQLFIMIARNAENALSNEAQHDKLTELPNRYYMSEYLNKMSAEKGLEGHWIAMADIDDFKHINDTYGHNCGDFVLQALAGIMKESGANYELCRWGGEEFLITGRVDGDFPQRRAELDRLRRTIEEHGFWYDENRLNLTVTIGIACYERGQSISEWVNAADKKLYEGKCNGKNQVAA